MTKEISRRGFISAAATAAAATALAGMTGCSGPKNAADKAADTAAADKRWSWETKPDAIPDNQIKETKEADICVIGLGSSGTTATLAAAQSGAKVITLQKMPTMQTNGWCVAAYNSKMFLDAGKTYDLAQIYASFANLSNGRDNPKAVKLFLRRSGEVVDYLIRQTPDFKPVMQATGHTYGWYINNDMATRYQQFGLLLNSMVDKAVAAGAEILYETPAVQLVQNSNGNVTGVIAKQKDGSYIKINASKGVIMATGDISDDKEMLECYAPLLLDVQSMHGAPCNTGDGHKMGLWAGAAMDEAPHCIMMHFDPTWMPEGNSPYSGIPWLRVNLKGERFANEDLGYQSVVTSVRLQQDKTAFQITDANWATHAVPGDYKHPNSHSRATANPAGDWQTALDHGAIVQANTLEELADKCGIDKTTFLATIKRYNELSDKGIDEDFGVNGDFISWNTIKTPPFFAIKRKPGLLTTISGLKINEKLEVIKPDGTPLGGLYAAGNASGSYYGDDYPLFITGGSHGRAWTFGVLSARSALGKLDESVATLGQ